MFLVVKWIRWQGVYRSGREVLPAIDVPGLTCDSYGKVRDDSTPTDPASYDYHRAARDALHFSALVDRFIQNLRRVLGYDAQYFGEIGRAHV